jgi:hypothetical protein
MRRNAENRTRHDTTEILRRTDVLAEFKARGGRVIPGAEPNDAGWVEVFAIDRNETTPGSCSLNVGKGPLRGRFTDLARPDAKCSFLELMVRMSPGEFPNFGAAVAHFAASAGMQASQKEGRRSRRTHASPSAGRSAPLDLDAYGEPVQPAPVATREPETPVGPVTNTTTKPPRQRVAEYRYLDAAGKLVHIVTRWSPKGFSQAHPGPDGSLIHKAPAESARVLYHLDCIASNPSLPVFVCEGEKDADRLQGGLRVDGKPTGIATTAPGGAAAGKSSRKWLPQFTESLRGRSVFILPDSDAPGREHAQTVAAALHGVAALVAIVDLPLPPTIDPARKWDVSDWINAGGTCAQFTEAVVAAQSRPWQPPEGTLGNRSPAVPGPVQPPAKLPITNVDSTAAGDIPVPVDAICSRILDQCGDWPRRVADTLFVQDLDAPGRPVIYLQRNPQLWAYVGSKSTTPPYFSREPGTATKEEVFHRLSQIVRTYDQIEHLPHFPPIDAHYYACQIPPIGDGTALEMLLDRFSPETEADHVLIKAMFLTPLWGGPGGCRPVFLITSDAGRGAGKTTLANLLAEVSGGMMSFSSNDDPQKMRERMLSPEGKKMRVAVLDNVKSHRFSWAELEALITSPVVSGRALYVGESRRVNTLTWCITMNGAGLSTDLAQRAILIKLRAAAYDGAWEEQTRALIRENREAIIGDIRACLADPASPLPHTSRWGRWERDVLSKIYGAAEAQGVYLQRQREVDGDAEETDLVEDFFRQQLASLGYNTDTQAIFIPAGIANRWVCVSLNERHSVTATSRKLNQHIDAKKFACLCRNLCNKWGRGFIWEGGEYDHSPIDLNLESRLNPRTTFEPF